MYVCVCVLTFETGYLHEIRNYSVLRCFASSRHASIQIRCSSFQHVAPLVLEIDGGAVLRATQHIQSRQHTPYAHAKRGSWGTAAPHDTQPRTSNSKFCRISFQHPAPISLTPLRNCSSSSALHRRRLFCFPGVGARGVAAFGSADTTTIRCTPHAYTHEQTVCVCVCVCV